MAVEDRVDLWGGTERAAGSGPEPRADVLRASGDVDVVTRLSAARERVRLEDEREAAESANSAPDSSSSRTPSRTSDGTPSRESPFAKPGNNVVGNKAYVKQ